MANGTAGTILRVTSHRAAEKLEKALGRAPEYHYTWCSGGQLVVLFGDELSRALAITGIRRARVNAADLHKCWS